MAPFIAAPAVVAAKPATVVVPAPPATGPAAPFVFQRVLSSSMRPMSQGSDFWSNDCQPWFRHPACRCSMSTAS